MAESDPVFEEPLTSVDVVPPANGSRLRRVALMISVPLVLAAIAAWYYLSHQHLVSTDNAYVQQDKVSVSAQVTGEIVEVSVRENQQVKAGDLLFRIDPEPFRIAIARADAAIAGAQVDVVQLQTELGTTGVDIDAASEDVAFFEEQYRRQAELMQRGFTTRSQLDEARHNLADARSRLATARADAIKARSKLATAPSAPGNFPRVLAAQAERRQALYNLAHTEVRAPVSGTVSQADRLQLGQMMTTGLPALTIVVSNRSWIEANFKETELSEMKVGQPATLTFDAYPGMKLKGHVASIGAGTGSEFSVLPAQNANGNWVKVTQRVPVRIAIDDKPARPLIAGLSTDVTIDTSR